MAEEKVNDKGKDFKHLVRIANTDLDGNKKIAFALRKIKGINFQFANMVCALAKIDGSSQVGFMKDDQVSKIDEIIKDPSKFNVPSWMLNRRRDYETNEDSHVIITDLDLAKDSDIKRMKKIKSYRGTRHMKGLPCRGQRTKSNFRRTKSKGGPKIGVVKKKAKAGRV